MPSDPPRPRSRDLALVLSHAERRLVQRLAALLAEEGCSVEQWRVLSAVADEGGLPMTEIAEYALLPAPSLTKLVDRMVADNLVYRRPDPGDRRRVLLHLAARGRILHQRAAHRVDQDHASVLAALHDTGELAGALEHLTEILSGGAPVERTPSG
jgi:DNA-binding MarR family transcriptional regulator